MSHSSLIATSLWRAQCLLHSNNNVALPAVLLSSAGVLLLYRHMTESVDGHDDLKTFLALIVIQMVPLLLLEMRIMAVKDPVAMLSKFGSKVMLMHASFLVLRLVVQGFDEVRSAMCNAAGLFAFVGVAVVHFNVRLSVKSFNANLSVIVLIAVAAIGALLFEIVDSYTRGRGIVYSKTFKVLVLSTTSDYIEILGFVPAVWMVYRGVDTSCDDTGEGDRNAAAGFFFAVLVFFYCLEDIGGALAIVWELPLAALAHIAHFLLLLDLAVYVLGNFYSPERMKATLRHYLPDSVSGLV